MENAPIVDAINSLSNLFCADKLKKIGLVLGIDETTINSSINVLKRMELDRLVVNSHDKPTTHNLVKSIVGNTDSISDGEADEQDNDLLTQLLKDISDATFDDVDLDTKFCDLMAATRQSKNRSKNIRAARGGVT